MYTQRNDDSVSAWFVFIVLAGLIIGLMLGLSLMGPSAEAIEGALKYPNLYEDELLEKHWTMASTIATGLVWTATAISAVFFYMRRKTLHMLCEIHKLIKDSSTFAENQNTVTTAEEQK